MMASEFANRYPRSVPVGTTAIVYALSLSQCAILVGDDTLPGDAEPPRAMPPNEGPHIPYQDGQLRIVDAASLPDDASVLPVYTNATNEHDAGIATGKVFVRLRSSMRLDEFVTELAECGCKLERVLSYAPQAGWVVASDTSASALNAIETLQALPDVEHVEAQVLRFAERK